MGYSLGVDLGTTFVAAALAVDGRAEMFTLGDRSEVTPSAVYRQDDGTLVTGEAAASLRTVNSADRVAREFKRRLGDPTPVVLGGRSYAAAELLGAQLRDVLDKVVESEGDRPENVVLTHPANWGPFRRTLFDGVLHFAGLDRAMKVTEPEAAAARYAATRDLDEGHLVAVYDLGGGTFDATILRKIPGGMEIVGIPEGIERLGGIDFDEAILRHVNFTSDNALNQLDMRDPRTIAALARLRQDCVLAKEALSADTETVVPVFLPERHFDVRLDRSTFEDLIRANVESTIGALARTLESAQVRPEELHAVLLIGGSSRIPLIAEMVSAELGRPIAIDTHPKYAVALGAATLGALGPNANMVTAAAPGSGPAVATGEAAAPGSGPAVATGEAAASAPPVKTPPASPPAAAAATPTPTVAVAAPAPPPAPPQQPKEPVTQALPPQAVPPATPPPPATAPTPPPRAFPTQTIPPQVRRPGYQPPYQPPGQQPPHQPSWYGQRTRQPGQPQPQRPRGSGGGKRAALLVTAVLALIIGGAAAFVLLEPGSAASTSEVGTPPGPAPLQPTLVLTSSEVKIGQSYYLTAYGFTPGENVRITWTGPTNGTMGASPADGTGTRTHGPILERDPPGTYRIIATGLRSGKTADAPLEVLPSDGSGN